MDFLKELSMAIDARAREIHAAESAVEVTSALADGKDLARALARLLNGEDLRSAFGAPGDWGYGSAIGKALANLHQNYPVSVRARFSVFKTGEN